MCSIPVLCSSRGFVGFDDIVYNDNVLLTCDLCCSLAPQRQSQCAVPQFFVQAKGLLDSVTVYNDNVPLACDLFCSPAPQRQSQQVTISPAAPAANFTPAAATQPFQRCQQTAEKVSQDQHWNCCWICLTLNCHQRSAGVRWRKKERVTIPNPDLHGLVTTRMILHWDGQ